MKINFDDNEEVAIVMFSNNYGVEIYPNFEMYVSNPNLNSISRYDVCPVGKDVRTNMIYNLFGFKLLPIERFYNLSQEQVEDICDDISKFPDYIPQDKDIALEHLSEFQIMNLINRLVEEVS